MLKWSIRYQIHGMPKICHLLIRIKWTTDEVRNRQLTSKSGLL